MKRSVISKFVNARWSTIVLFFVICIGLYLRFIHLSSWTWDMGGYDESRDMLVARHIVEYHDWVWRGPFAAGGHNILTNSAFYYYFIAAIWFLTRSPEVFMVAWAMIMAGVIPLGYFVGKKLWDKTTGIYIALLFAVHPTFVGMSKLLSQINLIPLWVLIVIHIIISKKHWSFGRAVCGLSMLFLGLHIHYGSFILVGGLYAWMSWTWWKNASISSRVGRIVGWALITEYVLLFWFYATYKVVPFDQFLFVDNNIKNAHPNIFVIIAGALRDTGSLLLYQVYDTRAQLVAIAGLVGYGIGFGSNLFSLRVRQFCVWGFVCTLSAYGVIGIYLGHLSLSYFYSVLPLYMIIFGVFLRRLSQQYYFLGGAVLVLLSSSLSYQAWHEMQPPTSISPYRSYREIAQAVAADYTKNISGDVRNEIPSFALATLSTAPYLVFDGWANGSTWYWLEEIFHKKLVQVTDGVMNFYPLATHPKYFYVICDHRESGEASAQVCLNRFTKIRPYISSTYSVVYASFAYTVWRFDIESIPQDNVYNVAYDELLNPKE